jgi:hypothetical protein
MKIYNIMTFREAVELTPDITNGYQVGLQAFGQCHNKIHVSDTRLIDGSVDIDACTEKKYPDENRWDYVLSYNRKVYFVEVHPACTSEVNVVLKKLQWLKDWLNRQAPNINKQKAPQPYYWVQSGKNAILKTSSQYRRISQSNLKPISLLRLQ